MKAILSPRHRAVLAAFAASKALVAFDFDGTLAPIVADRRRARMRPKTRALLSKVAALYPVVVISGRSRADVLRRLEGVALVEAIGNHGVESPGGARRYAARVRRWRPELGRRIGSIEGVVVEDKGLSLAIHYRQSRSRKSARAAIVKAAGKLEGARVVGGKAVVNVVPQGAPDKGAALEGVLGRLRCDRAIYVGDDQTDEDVFTLGGPAGRLIGVRVGASRASAARYWVRDQRAVDDLLEALVRCRKPPA